MTTLNIRLSDQLKRFVDNSAAKAGFATPADYVQSLIQRESRRRAEAKEALETKLLAGLSSGRRIEVNDAYWQKKQAKLLRNHRVRKAG